MAVEVNKLRSDVWLAFSHPFNGSRIAVREKTARLGILRCDNSHVGIIKLKVENGNVLYLRSLRTDFSRETMSRCSSQRSTIRPIACVKHQNMSGSDIGDDHKDYFSGEAGLKAAGKDNTMNQF
ncbi:hypothetical protein ACO0LB_17100 [Undibacterium sp. SXout7W]|uniref:hypothetical protein n=1 Tax=Undibacterium sp. SXout7W TaxID=3413049 RepID=UPI003BF32354